MRELPVLLGTAALCATSMSAQTRLPLSTQEEIATVHIRLLNGKTGQPVTGKQIFFERSGRLLSHREDRDIVTGPDGVASAEVSRSGYLVDPVIIDLHLCTKAEHVADKKDKVVRFSVADILTAGVKAKNSCGTATVEARPGELILWVRPMSALERLTD